MMRWSPPIISTPCNKLATVDELSADRIALRFGKTERHVLQRVEPTRVAAEFLKDFRAGKLTLSSYCRDNSRKLAEGSQCR